MIILKGQCAIWRGRQNSSGYGVVGKRLAHVVAYESVCAPLSKLEGLISLCGYKLCCNPSHWLPASLADVLHSNTPSRYEIEYVKVSPGSQHSYGESPRLAGRPPKQREHCNHGHALTEDNIYRWPKKPKYLYCKACHRARSRASARRRG